MEASRSSDSARAPAAATGAAAPVASPADTPDLTPAARDEVARALSNGPMGALIVAGIAVGLLFIGWLLFYFFLFLGRGDIG